jgi:hypothetical protein
VMLKLLHAMLKLELDGGDGRSGDAFVLTFLCFSFTESMCNISLTDLGRISLHQLGRSGRFYG